MDNGGVIPAEQLTKYYKTPSEPEIVTPPDVVDTENKKVIADVLDKNSEITNPGGGGHRYYDGQGGGGSGGGQFDTQSLYESDRNGGGSGGYNYRNRQEYR